MHSMPLTLLPFLSKSDIHPSLIFMPPPQARLLDLVVFIGVNSVFEKGTEIALKVGVFEYIPESCVAE